MACLSEFKCAVYADGEMQASEAREIAEHLETCGACRRLVEALRVESRVLVHSFQETDFIEFELEDEALNAPQVARLGPARFAAFILAMSVLLRPVLSALEEVELPDSLEWLNPFSTSGQVSLLATTLTTLLPAAANVLDSILSSARWIALGAIICLGILLFSRKSILTNAILTVLALLTVFSSSSYALDVRRGDKPVTVPAGETLDDTLVVAGNSVVVDGTVTGDLIAFVRSVTIRGTVKGNVISFAQRVEVEGNVEGSVMGFGQSVQTRGQVARNVYAFAQTASIGRSSRIEGNATVFAGQSDIEGTIGKDAYTAAGSVNVLAPAHVAGKLTARVNKADNVHIESGSTILGKTDIRVRQPVPSRYSTLSFYVWQTIWLAAAFLTGLLLFWLVPAFSRVPLETSRDLLLAAGVGFLAVIAPPIAAIVAAMTLIGLPLGLITLALWLAAGYLAKIVIAGFLGRSLLTRGGDTQAPAALILVAGLVPVFIAINLPYIGGLVGFLLTTLGLGSLVITTYQMPRGRHVPQAA